MPRFLTALALALAITLPATAKPPNIVMIIGGDQGWPDYGFMGHPHIETPHLDELASESLVFRRGYVPSSLMRTGMQRTRSSSTCTTTGGSKIRTRGGRPRNRSGRPTTPGDRPPARTVRSGEDPIESTSLAAQRPENVAALKKKLDAWWKPE